MLEFIHSSGWGGGERLFEFDWEEEGVGAYSRWALIRGWALIRINTVIHHNQLLMTKFGRIIFVFNEEVT